MSTNILHSSDTDKWYTPPEILDRARNVLGKIDLDPASDPVGNKLVRADRYMTKEEDGLKAVWPSGCSIWLNPPGGKMRNKSVSGLFWKKLMEYRGAGLLQHAIFLAFSTSALQHTQDKNILPMATFAVCIPSRRLRFLLPSGEVGARPSHSNAIIYVPGLKNDIDKFYTAFRDTGCILLGTLFEGVRDHLGVSAASEWQWFSKWQYLTGSSAKITI